MALVGDVVDVLIWAMVAGTVEGVVVEFLRPLPGLRKAAEDVEMIMSLVIGTIVVSMVVMIGDEVAVEVLLVGVIVIKTLVMIVAVVVVLTGMIRVLAYTRR